MTKFKDCLTWLAFLLTPPTPTTKPIYNGWLRGTHLNPLTHLQEESNAYILPMADADPRDDRYAQGQAQAQAEGQAETYKTYN